MQVTDFQLKKNGSYAELSALMDDYRLWYRIPIEYEASMAGDAFLVAGFFPSMASGKTLELDSTVRISKKLVRNMTRLQEIFHCWNPLLKKFKINGTEAVSEPKNTGTASFFSGGIDGSCTLLRNFDEIKNLIYINGFDFELGSKDFNDVVTRLHRMSSLLNKSLIAVDTNFYSFISQHRISRILNFGSCLASVAHVLGFPKIYIPSSETYNDLHPLGSHPLTDPLWSNEATEIIHDGAHLKRTQKTRLLIENDVIMDNLVVCWEKPNNNCCKCQKCIRTMITLKLLGVNSLAFPSELRLRNVARIRIKSSYYRKYFYDNLELAEQKGDRKMVVALKKALRRSAILLLIEDLDRQYLGETLKKIIQFFMYGKIPKNQNLIYPTTK